MQRYETLIVLDPELPDAQVRETIDRTRRLIGEMQGQVEDVDFWGIRELAYSIRKVTRGYYVLVHYLGHAALVNEIDRTFRISDEVLRFITVVADGAPSRREEEDSLDTSSPLTGGQDEDPAADPGEREATTSGD